MHLEFKRLDVIIARPGSPPEETADVVVCWEIVPVYNDLAQAVFTVERSMSPAFPASDTSVISEAIAGIAGQFIYTFSDITPSLINEWRKYFYRVRAVSGLDTNLSLAATWEKAPKVYELAIIERHDFVLRYIQGAPSFAFIERTAESAPCHCFDRTAQRPSKSNCTTCLGTGRQRPYFDPIPFYVDYNPGEQLIQMAALGEMHVKQRSCWFSAYPILKARDLVYQCGSGEIYRIIKVGPNSEPQGVTLQQVAVLEALDRKDVEYSVLTRQIPEAQLLSIMREWDLVRQDRMF